MIVFYDSFLHALIDFDTFALLTYVKKLGKSSKVLDVIYYIVVLLKDIIYLDQGLKSYPIQIVDNKLIMNLTILNV